jgi:Fe2+ or Zn2+ uptake regulation protein
MMSQTSFDFEQREHLDRVSSRIGAAVLEFCQAHKHFHAGELHSHVERATGVSAPASADRILRSLRQRRVVDYRVVSRRESLYEVVSVRAA